MSQYNAPSTASARTLQEQYFCGTFHFTVVLALLEQRIFGEDLGLKFSGKLRALLESKECGGERLFEQYGVIS
jgi:hypothetical protein